MNNQSDNSDSSSEIVRVLVLDDEPADSRHLSWLLEQSDYRKYEITTALSQEAATREFDKNCFDVILSDYWLGEESSLDFIRKTGGRLEGTPVVLISSLSINEIRRGGLSAGAAACLSKADLTVSLLESAIEDARHTVALERRILDQSVGLEPLAGGRQKQDGKLADEIRDKLSELDELIHHELSKAGFGNLTVALEISNEIHELCNARDTGLIDIRSQRIGDETFDVRALLLEMSENLNAAVWSGSHKVVWHVPDVPMRVRSCENSLTDLIWLLWKLTKYSLSAPSEVHWRPSFERGDLRIAIESTISQSDVDELDDIGHLTRNISENLQLVIRRTLRPLRGRLELVNEPNEWSATIIIPRRETQETVTA